jgi:hypothetical protein
MQMAMGDTVFFDVPMLHQHILDVSYKLRIEQEDHRIYVREGKLADGEIYVTNMKTGERRIRNK